MITVKSYSAPEISEKEIIRYAGGGDGPEFLRLTDECIKEAKSAFSYRACFDILPVEINENTVNFGFAAVISKDLATALKSYEKALIFCATVGVEIDRIITKYSRISPAKALIFQAFGAERIEALCDEVCKEYKGGKFRFSPGYGDLPIEFQKEIFNYFNPSKSIGLTLRESLIMSPSKSVSAIMGVK